jgi:hypothetical protein
VISFLGSLIMALNPWREFHFVEEGSLSKLAAGFSESQWSMPLEPLAALMYGL